MPQYDYPRPAFTADIVVVPRGTSQVLLIHRGNDPYKGQLALPGGFVNEGESGMDAAVRELFEETGLSVESWELIPIGIFDEPGRDPRGWVISSAYLVVVDDAFVLYPGDDAVTAAWYDYDDLEDDLAFDHDDIVCGAWVAIAQDSVLSREFEGVL